MKKLIVVFVVLAALGTGVYFFRSTLFPVPAAKTLTIVTNTPETDISPYGLDLNNITRIQNIYEGLVAFDRYLKLVPALAVSWGNTGENQWEFRLRQGVKFHDGTLFTAQDVLDAFQKIRRSRNSQMAAYFSTVKDITKTDDGRITVTTFLPDPLLLSKLTKLFVYHQNNVGTGPYMLDRYEPGVSFSLKAFPGYWGDKPYYKNVVYKVIANRTQREDEFSSGNIDILMGVTEEQALQLPPSQIISSYGLEVNFLMFQLDDPVFKDKSIRQAVYSLIDPKKIEEIGNHFVRSCNQFIAPGVFGYNANIPTYPYDANKEASNLFGGRLQRIDFDYPASFSTLSEYLSNQLRKAGFSVDGHADDPDVLVSKIENRQTPLFLIGWRAEDGDAGSFYDAFVYSKGPFNNGRYVNPEVDELIEQSRTEMDPQKRLVLLQEIGQKVNEDLIGIPLFETSRIFAIQKDIKWSPRLDGQVLGAEVSQKN